MAEQEYVLGTHDEEISRLGLQHRVWRSRTLECWTRAGLTSGFNVLDVGAGPGFASVDLAEIVGPSGSVTAFERSERFVGIGTKRLEAMSLENSKYVQGDLMLDELPTGPFDMAWVRWVFCFLPDPSLALRKIARALAPGGRLAIHEYVDYGTWRAIPEKPAIESFVQAAMRQWRDNGGEPDIARSLPALLRECGFEIVHAVPIVFSMSPNDYAWGWPQAFIRNQASRLVEDGHLPVSTAEQAIREFGDLSGDPHSSMLSPMVLEVIAKRR